MICDVLRLHYLFFFFNDTATTEIYTLSLHDALPIWSQKLRQPEVEHLGLPLLSHEDVRRLDRKSTRLNSSHSQISYAVFCLKKKKTKLPIYLATLGPKNLELTGELADAWIGTSFMQE